MPKKIGELLVAEGALSEEALARALELQGLVARGTRLGAILLRWDLLAEKDLLDALSKLHGCPAADWGVLSSAAPTAVRLLSSTQASRLGALPYEADKKTVRVAFLNPSNLAVVDEVHAITGRRVLPAVTSEVRMMQAQQKFYLRAMSRELWTLVQKLETRQSVGRAPAMPPTPAAPPPPPDLRGGLDSATEENLAEPGAAPPSQKDPEIAEIAEFLLPLVDDPWPVHEGQPEPKPAPPSEIRAEGAAVVPNPLEDDGPLSKFLADVLVYFESNSDLKAALASLDDEPVEDLEGAIEERSGSEPEREAPGSESLLDTTHPSRKRRRNSSSPVSV